MNNSTDILINVAASSMNNQLHYSNSITVYVSRKAPSSCL